MRSWLTCLVCAICMQCGFLASLTAQEAPEGKAVSIAAQIEDSRKHLQQFYKGLEALPKKQQKSLIKESNQAYTSALKSNASFSPEQKMLAKILSIKKSSVLATKLSAFERVNLAPLVKLQALELRYSLIKQVTYGHLPSYAVNPPALPNQAGTSQICSPCGPGGFLISIEGVQKKLDLLRKVANSVGRIELKGPAGPAGPDFIGTAFVISKSQGILATACHVVTAFAHFESNSGSWTLTHDVVADFDETPDRLQGRQFRVTGIAYVPALQGCDAALIKVDPTALDGVGQLPDAVPLASPQMYAYSSRIEVATLGYPGLSDSDLKGATPTTIAYFSCLKSQQPTIAKFIFAGWADPLEQTPTGYHVFNHLAPTTSGQSGSPIIAITDQGIGAIGIHYCCTKTPASSAGDNQCENWSVKDHDQEAIDLNDVLSGAQQAGVITAQDLSAPGGAGYAAVGQSLAARGHIQSFPYRGILPAHGPTQNLPSGFGVAPPEAAF